MRLAMARCGSPPRTRGRVPDLGQGCVAGRITPAYAGKSGAGRAIVIHNEDHPRVRGEEVPAYGYVRGLTRITPAYAGKRVDDMRVTRCPADHPRVRGEELLRKDIY